VNAVNEDIPLSDRERVEGFQYSQSSVVTISQSERVEGFRHSQSPAVTIS